ncbi:MAG: Bro-N domain-containing protein [Gammaproteobacteria bacterium]|nr:Bro-N domain-containing protein [Gammaproteobacteria bacterium]MBU1731027.1 Bro-N domain-containing protein [Gammaproteobacteria bacterium]MBU1893687.1 Bro-N domain-containing protein [Gammaproteobacteria bacterium]
MSENQSSTSVLIFNETEFDVVDIHNIPWLRGGQVAQALGYQNPASDIGKLYERNTDEFSDEMVQTVELETAGGRQQVRIFSPRGCYLIGMLARTEKAKEFRKWVLDVLEGRTVPRESRPMTIPQQIASHRLRISLLKELKAETAPGMRRALHQQVRHVSGLIGLPVPQIGEIGKDEPQQALPGV